jgi:hypothetical protein
VVRVDICDYVPLQDHTLTYAESEAGRLLRGAGIELEWVECGKAARLGKDDTLTVRVIRRAREPFGKEVLGFALPSPRGGMATVFYDHAEALRQRRTLVYQVLGRAMAHEIAHLLLGPGSHSMGGAMRALHAVEEFGAEGNNQWFFTATEGALMRQYVLRRSAGGVCPGC